MSKRKVQFCIVIIVLVLVIFVELYRFTHTVIKRKEITEVIVYCLHCFTPRELVTAFSERWVRRKRQTKYS